MHIPELHVWIRYGVTNATDFQADYIHVCGQVKSKKAKDVGGENDRHTGIGVHFKHVCEDLNIAATHLIFWASTKAALEVCHVMASGNRVECKYCIYMYIAI